MHAHANELYCVCLFVTKQDFKFEKNPFMNSRDIGCAHCAFCERAHTFQMSS